MKNPDAGIEAPLVFEPNLTFDGILRAWRGMAGLTQVQAADLLGVPLPTFQGWEQGRPTPVARAITLLIGFLMATEKK